ncbi:hypothetical protein SRABI106_04539 [Rahnella aquatilis]|nr:hypothetical protein SRABI106_04539 [Rahnella aquatilis]
MVIIQFIAEIKPDIAEIVVENAKTDTIAPRQGKRDMLIQRIGAGGVITHRIQITHFKAAAATVEITGFLAQSVHAILRLTQLIVRRCFVFHAEHIRTGFPIFYQRLPDTGLIFIFPLQPQRLMHRDAQRLSGQCQAIVALFELITRH